MSVEIAQNIIMAVQPGSVNVKKPLTGRQLMAMAVTRRNELNVFIRLMTETLAGGGLHEPVRSGVQSPTQDRGLA